MDPFLDFINSLEFWQLALIVVGLVVLVILALICCCYCCIGRNRYKPDAADMKMAQGFIEQQVGTRQFSTNTIAKNLNAQPSSQLASKFGGRRKAKPTYQEADVEAQVDASLDDTSIKPERDAEGKPTFSPNVMKNLATKDKQKSNVSAKRQQKGLSYGRLSSEAQGRIRSVRLEANKNGLMPIKAAPPSSKALRMMGITEEQSTQAYSEDVQTRMKRIAAGAGGGIYSAGFSTSKLGGQIIDGFKARREAIDRRAAERKEKQEFQKTLARKRKTLEKQIEPVNPPPKEEQKKKKKQ